jgi:agmatinase
MLKVNFTENKNYFLGIKPKLHNLNACRFCIVSVRFEKTTTYRKGTAHGPRAIIDASTQVELYDEELKSRTYKHGIFTHKPVNCKGSVKNVFKRINTTAKKILCHGVTPFFIGGEHSISQAIIPAFLAKYKNLSILHFDAHADLRKSYQGLKHSHASAMHPFIKKCPIVQVGIRSIAEEELKFTNKGKVKTFKMHKNPDVKKLTQKVLKHLTQNVYISIDADGFDPAVMPAVGTPEPGGFLWYQALHLFKKVCFEKNVVGADIVEVSPDGKSVITEFTAAKLIYRLMGYLGRIDN